MTTLRLFRRPVSDSAGGLPVVRATPTRAHQLGNVAITQAAWFAAVAGAAHGRPDLGTLPALGAVAWHLSVAGRPGAEARLVLAVTVLGALAETVLLAAGHVAYPSGQWAPALPPYWLVALWAVFALSLNVTLRWLRGRPWLAAVMGAVAGPAAFASGVRLGGARFIDPVAALSLLAVAWAMLMPLLVAMAARWDGISPTPEDRSHG